MITFSSLGDANVADLLRQGAAGVVRTDTLYGVVGLANNRLAFEKVYKAKRRSHIRPSIVLISSLTQMFDQPPVLAEPFLNEVWPGKTSVILPSVKAPEWVQCGTGTVSYRLVEAGELADLITAVGPLVAPSANPEGLPPASTLQQAIEYFGESVDFYVDGGEVINDEPSKIYRFDENGKPERLR